MLKTILQLFYTFLHKQLFYLLQLYFLLLPEGRETPKHVPEIQLWHHVCSLSCWLMCLTPSRHRATSASHWGVVSYYANNYRQNRNFLERKSQFKPKQMLIIHIHIEVFALIYTYFSFECSDDIFRLGEQVKSLFSPKLIT